MSVKQVFLISCMSTAMLLSACGGSDNKNNSGSSNTPPPSTEGNPSTVQKDVLTGTVAIGAAVKQAKVEVVNKNGQVAAATTDDQGKFSLEVEQAPPYMIKVKKDDLELFSYAAAAGYINVTQLTSLAILSANAQIEGGPIHHSLNELFHHWQSYLTKVDVKDINAALEETSKQTIANLKAIFEASGYTESTGFPDIFKTKFDANSIGLDQVLDLVKINGLNNTCTGTGSVYNCNVTYHVNGINIPWSYSMNTLGIDINVDAANIVTPPVATGDYTVKVTNTFLGASHTVTIKNVPKPASQTKFCDINLAEVKKQLSVLGTNLTIEHCSFNGTAGEISAVLKQNGINVSYKAQYQYLS